MASQKFLVREGGKTKQKQAVEASLGAADAGKIPALNSSGKLDGSMMPAGIGAQVVLLEVTESISAGKFINYFNDGGTLKVRLADNSNGREANGYVLESFTSSQTATVYPLDGVNSELTGLTVGSDYWLGTAGGVIDTPLDESNAGNSGYVSQQLGKAKSSTELITDDYGFVIL